MQSNNEYTPFAYGNLSDGNSIPVPVIAAFDARGRIKPLYIRINGESFRIETYRETRVSTVSRFDCTVNSHNRRTPVVCLYFRTTGTWMMERFN